MNKSQGSQQEDTEKKARMKSKWAKRERRLQKVRDEEIEMSEVDQQILDVSYKLVRLLNALNKTAHRALKRERL